MTDGIQRVHLGLRAPTAQNRGGRKLALAASMSSVAVSAQARSARVSRRAPVHASNARPAMPVVSEMQHPNGFHFETQRKIVILRDVQHLTWGEIARRVKTLSGARPRPRHCANYYRKFNAKKGRVVSKYHKCGPRGPHKATKEVERFLIEQLKRQRRVSTCTSKSLQVDLAKEMDVQLSDSCIRKILLRNGYKWLPRRQGRLYTKEQRKARLKFSHHVLKLSKKGLREKLSLAMDGTVIPMPPADPTDRLNFLKHDEEYMWRKHGESFKPSLSGQDSYHSQVPLPRAVPLWGGCSEGGFSTVTFHARKKLTGGEWAAAVRSGKLVGAIQRLKPTLRNGPWHVLCDNEGFLNTGDASKEHKAARVKLWRIPSRSPDLNPVERFWGWLKKTLHRMDLKDAQAKKAPLGKMAYRERVRAVCRSKKAQTVASNYAKSFRKVCAAVVKKKGAASGL